MSFLSHIFLNSIEKDFVRWVRQQPEGQPNRKLKLLVQMPESYYYLLIFTLSTLALRRNFQLDLHWIEVVAPFQREGRFRFLKRSKWFSRKWTQLYLANGGHVSLSNMTLPRNTSPGSIARATEIYNQLKSKEDVLNIELDGILIGDLIYDTYLRFKPAPTVDIRDSKLLEILTCSVQIFENSLIYLETHRVDAVFTSYTSYIHHGILTRVALAKNVKVISFASFDHFSKKVSKEYPFHVKDFPVFHELFQKLSENEQIKARELASLAIKKRFEGVIDPATFYMKQSAFAPVGDEAPAFRNNGKKRGVVFLHCFFDSPHCYRTMLYPDFYEWVYATLRIGEASQEKGEYEFYVKPHPNGVPDNEPIVEELKRRFPKLTFIDKKTSNLKLIREGFDLAVTVYGTLGHEYPYFGIPVLNAGDNPHINYDFCTHPRTREEYEDLLLNPSKIARPSEKSKSSIYEFFYMNSEYPFSGKIPRDENEKIFSVANYSADSPGGLGEAVLNLRKPQVLNDILLGANRSLLMHF